jgi:hypothetical protein
VPSWTVSNWTQEDIDASTPPGQTPMRAEDVPTLGFDDPIIDGPDDDDGDDPPPQPRRKFDARRLIRRSKAFEATTGPPPDVEKPRCGVSAPREAYSTGKAKTDRSDLPKNSAGIQPRFFAARIGAPAWPANRRARAPP